MALRLGQRRTAGHHFAHEQSVVARIERTGQTICLTRIISAMKGSPWPSSLSSRLDKASMARTSLPLVEPRRQRVLRPRL
jgi:hypothetical protein